MLLQASHPLSATRCANTPAPSQFSRFSWVSRASRVSMVSRARRQVWAYAYVSKQYSARSGV
jgi:hypothetical protein